MIIGCKRINLNILPKSKNRFRFFSSLQFRKVGYTTSIKVGYTQYVYLGVGVHCKEHTENNKMI